MNKISKIAVFCGSSFGNNDDFISSTKALGKAFARNNITLVYGGGYRGFMGALAEAVQANNGHVIGVLPEIFNNEKVKIKQVEDELIVTKDMHSRKKQIYDIADAFIILPGGIGTFDEFFEIFTWKQIGYHEKNIAIYNINGFYDTLLSFLKECCTKGFLREEVLNSLIVKTDPDAIIEELKTRKTNLPSKI